MTSDPGDNGESESPDTLTLWSQSCWQQEPFIEQGLYVLLPAVEATIKFTYVEKYPDEPPLWEIHSQENLEDRDAEDILTLLQQQVSPKEIGFIPTFRLI